MYLFDELSNDIDIPTLTILEDFLNSFAGIVITVSHDRYFLDNVVDRIFEFDGDGHLQQYEGGYTDYLEAKQCREKEREEAERNMAAKGGNATGTEQGGKTEGDGKAANKDWKQNRQTKLKFSFKEQREYETIDGEIAALEEKIASIEKEILANATNSGKLNELMEQKEKAEQELEEKMDRWVYLNDLAEKIEAQKQ